MHDGAVVGGVARRVLSFAPSTTPRFESDASGSAALHVNPDDDVRAFLPALADVTLVTLTFPKGSEGRPYTQARVLREELGYTGRIRAVGAVTVDALAFMRRVGIDEAILRDVSDEAFALDVLARFTVKYQAAADERSPLWRRVVRGAPAAASTAAIVHRGSAGETPTRPDRR